MERKKFIKDISNNFKENNQRFFNYSYKIIDYIRNKTRNHVSDFNPRNFSSLSFIFKEELTDDYFVLMDIFANGLILFYFKKEYRNWENEISAPNISFYIQDDEDFVILDETILKLKEYLLSKKALKVVS